MMATQQSKKRILIVAATAFEIAPLIDYLEKNAKKASFFDFEYQGLTISLLVTGVGAMSTAFGLSRQPGVEDIKAFVNLGVCGAFDQDVALGTVYEITRDRFADIGVEERDGSFTDVYQMGLTKANTFPYKDGWIEKPQFLVDSKLPGATALTVNRVHGTQQSIDRIQDKYDADVESMEGAGFYYAAHMMDLKAIQIRAVSNHVEPRNRDNWRIDLAIDNLNSTAIDVIDRLSVALTAGY